MSRLLISGAMLLALAACQNDDEIPGYDALARQVEAAQIGSDHDQWIELKNLAGEWERTGLIFGYLGDYDECLKAVSGLQAANPLREYRCVPAN